MYNTSQACEIARMLEGAEDFSHHPIWNTNQAVAFVREAGIGDGLTSGEAEAQNCRRRNEIKRMLWS